MRSLNGSEYLTNTVIAMLQLSIKSELVKQLEKETLKNLNQK